VCYFPKPTDHSFIACVVPLQGDACDLEKKYQKMLTGASSIVVLISFMLVPRAIEFVFSLLFGVCCRTAFVKTQGKTVKGVSLGVMILAGLGVLVVLLIANGGSGFIGLRFAVWAATWIGSMVIFEPIAGLLSYYLIRCDGDKTAVDVAGDGDDDDDAGGETRPLIETSRTVVLEEEASPSPPLPPSNNVPQEPQITLDTSENV
jgi:hypothetical protein